MTTNELKNITNTFKTNNFLITEDVANEILEDTFFNVSDYETRQDIYNNVNFLNRMEG